MQRRQIGKYTGYILEPQDVVVVMGQTEDQAERLRRWGFRRDDATGEWVGTGQALYGLSPEDYYDLFSGGQGHPPVLTAQVTDGEGVYQVDGLPVTEPGGDGEGRIVEITAVDLATRNTIDEGVSNLRVG